LSIHFHGCSAADHFYHRLDYKVRIVK
jgi:hypothetical protein